MKWKQSLVDYLSFTRRERIGILVLISLILIITLLPRFISQNGNVSSKPADTAWIAAARKLEIRESESNERKSYTSRSGDNDQTYQYDRSAGTTAAGSLFYFDPNTLGHSGWKTLGLKDKTIQTIQNYLNKGGSFNKPEDLQRIYGLHATDYNRLAPYIKIESREPESIHSTNEYAKKEIGFKRFSYNPIDVNAADTSAFIALPGIGSKLAARIVNFRDKLGGFYSVDQVGEVYGLADSVFQKIRQYLKLEKIHVKKIDINKVTVDELKAHPYFKYNLANPLIAYRNEHGHFSKIEDIKKVMAVTDEVYQKIYPYLDIL